MPDYLRANAAYVKLNTIFQMVKAHTFLLRSLSLKVIMNFEGKHAG